MKWFKSRRNRESLEAALNKEPTLEKDVCRAIAAEAEKRRQNRLPFELQWRLNTNFLLGNQHCDINAHRMVVENYKPLYDYMSNEVFNRIAPIMETRHAHLISVDYSLKAVEKDDSYEELEKARTLTAFLQIRQKSADYESAFARMLGLCEQTGSAFFLCWWNNKTGSVETTVLSPYEVLPEELYTEELSEQRSLILEQIKTVGEIKELFGVNVCSEQVSSYGLRQVGGAGGFGYESAAVSFEPVEKEGCAVVRTYMEKPSGDHPEGRLIMTAGNELLYEGVLPGGVYPLCQVKSKRVSGQFFAKSVIETLIPLQRSYNGVKNRLNDVVNRVTNGQLMIEDGSVDADDLSENGLVPGQPVIYRRGARLPELLETPQLDATALSHCDQLGKDMEYAAGVSGLMTGTTLPGGVKSGSAIESLRSIDRTRLTIYTENIRRGVRQLALLWLTLHTRFGGGQLFFPAEADAQAPLDGFEESRLQFVHENEPRESEEKKREKLKEAMNLGLFCDNGAQPFSEKQRRMLLRSFVGGDLSPLCDEELQQRNAEREQISFEQGETPALLPFDDDEIHLRAHRAYVLGLPFRRLLISDKEKAEPMLAHIKEHEKQIALRKGNTEKTEEEGSAHE